MQPCKPPASAAPLPTTGNAVHLARGPVRRYSDQVRAHSTLASTLRSPVTDAERLRVRVRPSGIAIIRQRWQALGFLHWAVDPAVLVPLLPPGLELDSWEGRGYVGIVPFTIRGSRAAWLPAIPGLAHFHELNLRTYVHRQGRAPGVLFFSLDAASRFAVWAARAAYKLPYYAADITMDRQADGVAFASRRRGPGGPASFSCRYWPTAAAEAAAPGTLEFFLAERYLLYSWDGHALRTARVWHAPYPLAPERVEDLTEELASASRITLPSYDEPVVHYASGVDVRIYPPSLVTPRPLSPGEVPGAAD